MVEIRPQLDTQEHSDGGQKGENPQNPALPQSARWIGPGQTVVAPSGNRGLATIGQGEPPTGDAEIDDLICVIAEAYLQQLEHPQMACKGPYKF